MTALLVVKIVAEVAALTWVSLRLARWMVRGEG